MGVISHILDSNMFGNRKTLFGLKEKWESQRTLVVATSNLDTQLKINTQNEL